MRAARAELRRCAGSQFDQRVVDAFLAALHARERARRGDARERHRYGLLILLGGGARGVVVVVTLAVLAVARAA